MKPMSSSEPVCAEAAGLVVAGAGVTAGVGVVDGVAVLPPPTTTGATARPLPESDGTDPLPEVGGTTRST
ncbi:hypothetical protein D3C78_1733890 [compost metagenome]